MNAVSETEVIILVDNDTMNNTSEVSIVCDEIVFAPLDQFVLVPNRMLPVVELLYALTKVRAYKRSKK